MNLRRLFGKSSATGIIKLLNVDGVRYAKSNNLHKRKEVNKLTDRKVAYLLKCFRETGNPKFLRRAKKLSKEKERESESYGNNTARQWPVPC